ncbi:MAG: putative integral rane protein [Actinomycetia bacterium]|nr:putative integral rane protein [Actinomycetes bacterium]
MTLRSGDDSQTRRMSASSPLATGRRIASIMWFPFLFAIALPLIFQLAFHAPQPHQVAIAVVGNNRQVESVVRELHDVRSGGFEVDQARSQAEAIAAVRDRQVAAAYVATSPPSPVLYVARAASAVRASYLQGVFAQLAVETRAPAPLLVDTVPLLSGDSGNGAFFFVFTMLLVALVTVLVLLQRASAWSTGRRMLAVAVIGAVGATTAYFTVERLRVLPGKPVLLFYAFFVGQVFGQLLLGAAPLLKQYFLPFAMTFILILSVPSAGGTVPPDLLPTGLRFLSNVLPLAQGVKITRSVAFFDGADLLPPTAILVGWAVVALTVLLVSSKRNKPSGDPRSSGVTAAEPFRVRSAEPHSDVSAA